MTRAPDYAEPIRGWRVWRVAAARGTIRLWSVLYDEPWQPLAPFRAVCVSDPAHAAPTTGCACGVHAARSVNRAARYLIGRDDPEIVHRVFGVVALWGDVFEGVDGWRAELAYPDRLWVPASPRADEIAGALEAYGVPLELLAVRKPLDVAAALAA